MSASASSTTGYNASFVKQEKRLAARKLLVQAMAENANVVHKIQVERQFPLRSL
jgi:hypothetical protein